MCGDLPPPPEAHGIPGIVEVELDLFRQTRPVKGQLPVLTSSRALAALLPFDL